MTNKTNIQKYRDCLAQNLDAFNLKNITLDVLDRLEAAEARIAENETYRNGWNLLKERAEKAEARIDEQQAAIGQLNATIARLSEDKSQFALIINSNYDAAQIQKANHEARIAGVDKALHEALHREKRVERKLLAKEAELAKLKGDAVPVAVVELNDYLTVAEIRGETPRRKAVKELYDNALVVGQELFTAPQKPVAPEGLHPQTAKLVIEFATALAEKLHKAEQKYGYSDTWMRPHWQIKCLDDFKHHVSKGDPRDVAAYCAFMWYHGWPTAIEAAGGTVEGDNG